MVKELKTEGELHQMMLAAAREHEECRELEDLIIFGPMLRPDANWGFGIAGKEVPGRLQSKITGIIRSNRRGHRHSLEKIRALPGVSPGIKGSQFSEFRSF